MMNIYSLAALLLAVFANVTLAEQQPDSGDVPAQLRGLFFDAARRGDVPMLSTFVEAHYPLNSQDEKGYTALILAAYHGEQAAVELLLQAGADACQQDLRGNTALMGAIFKGEVRIAQRLLATHCNPDQRNGAGQTAAMYAGLFKRDDLLAALAAKGADLQAEDALGNSATRLANGDIRMPASR